MHVKSDRSMKIEVERRCNDHKKLTDYIYIGRKDNALKQDLQSLPAYKPLSFAYNMNILEVYYVYDSWGSFMPDCTIPPYSL